MYQFQNEQELLKFVEPALRIRVKILLELGIAMTEEELFRFLKENKWKNKKDLHIYEIVHDILNGEVKKEVRQKS